MAPFHPSKSPERVLQSQIDAAQKQYLWSCAMFHNEFIANPHGTWTEFYRVKASRWKKAWVTLMEIRTNG